jgi:glycosyltransferase involved in cell wall biosynthesis
MISVIICTYNRANLLKRALNSLARQSVKDFEIIIVDDGSEDNTCEICNSFKDRITSLKYIYVKNSGLSYARNVGIKSSTGDYILFTDDDCIPEENWVERMGFYLKRETIVAGVITSPVSNYLKLCHNIAQFHNFMPGKKAGTVPPVYLLKIAWCIGAFHGLKESKTYES